MAIKTQSAAAVQSHTPAAEAPGMVASMNPDNMLQGGLKDDFDGTILKARLVPWDYDGNIDHHILAVALTIKPDDEKEPFVQHYSCGELEQFVPSMDAKTPVDLTSDDMSAMEGIYAFRVGKKEQLNNNTNWAHFVTAALDANFPKANLGAAVTFIEGVYGHFNRIPQKKRSGIVVAQAAGPADGKRARSNDILVLTEIKDKPAGAGAGAKAAKSAVGGANPGNGAVGAAQAAIPTGDLDARIHQVVVDALTSAGEAGLAKTKLPSIVIKAFTGPDKARAVKRVSESEFHETATGWVLDGDTGMLLGV